MWSGRFASSYTTSGSRRERSTSPRLNFSHHARRFSTSACDIAPALFRSALEVAGISGSGDGDQPLGELKQLPARLLVVGLRQRRGLLRAVEVGAANTLEVG